MSGNLPLVSVCIPAYNSAKWISDTLVSAVNQTWQNKEIIIVDDGSTDNTWEIIESFIAKYPHIIRAFRQNNKGACAARNFAFRESKGIYIQWLDSDDLLHPQKLEIQINYSNQTKDPQILFCGSLGIFRKNPSRSIFLENELSTDLNPLDWMIIFLGKVLMTQPGAWLIHRNLIEKAGLWDESLIRNQDGEYIFRTVANSTFIKFTKEAKLFYRKSNPSSISSDYSTKAIESVFHSIKNCIDILYQKDRSNRADEAVKYALRIFISRYFYSSAPAVKTAIELLKNYGETFDVPDESFPFKALKYILGLNSVLRLKSFWGKLKNSFILK